MQNIREAIEKQDYRNLVETMMGYTDDLERKDLRERVSEAYNAIDRNISNIIKENKGISPNDAAELAIKDFRQHMHSLVDAVESDMLQSEVEYTDSPQQQAETSNAPPIRDLKFDESPDLKQQTTSESFESDASDSKRPKVSALIAAGVVLEETDGQPLGRAIVEIKGTEVGGTTDEAGEFELPVPPGADTLIVSHRDYNEKEVSITEDRMEIILSPIESEEEEKAEDNETEEENPEAEEVQVEEEGQGQEEPASEPEEEEITDTTYTYYASVSPPSVEGEDQLNIMPDVRAFARLVSSRALQPPLSIGLFGDWGSGKSFFMEKLHEEVNECVTFSRKMIAAEKKTIDAKLEKNQDGEQGIAKIIDEVKPAVEAQLDQIKNWIENRDSWGYASLERIFGNEERINQVIGDMDNSINEEVKVRAEEGLKGDLIKSEKAHQQELAKQLNLNLHDKNAKNTLDLMTEAHVQLRAPYYRNIAQIKFNAWHYIDTNLWASLMVRVFESLNRFVGNMSPDEKKRIDLYRSLTITQEMTREKDKQIKDIAKEIDAIESQIAQLESEKSDVASNALNNISAKDVWEVVKRKEYYRTFQNQLKTALVDSGQSIGLNLAEEIETAERKIMGDAYEESNSLVGEDGELKDVPPGLVKLNIMKHKAAIDDLIDNTRSLQNRSKTLWNYLKGLRGKELAGFLFFLTIAVVVSLGLFNMLNVSLPDSWGSYLKQGVAGFSAAVPIFLKYLQSANKSVEKAKHIFGFFDEAKSDLDELKNRATLELEGQIQLKRQDIAAAKERQASLYEEKTKLESQQEALKEQKAEMESGRQLAAYLEKRLEEADYQKHLGLISTIREDLEKLTSYLHQRGKYTRLIHQLYEQNDKAEEENAYSLERINTVDRIILYIDDLDRCPPDKVVEVLQATHLLLAFPLFVVVVGVDVRWISRSLLKKYGDMLGAGSIVVNGGENGSSQRKLMFKGDASPYDYLEKIFQIPFRLKLMEDKDKLKYVDSLIQSDEEEEAKDKEREKAAEGEKDTDSSSTKPPKGPSKDSPETSSTANLALNVDSGEVQTPADQNETKPKQEDAADQLETPEDGESDETETRDITPREGSIASIPVPVVAAGAVRTSVQVYQQSYFTQVERDLLKVLSPILSGKPRTVKRYINVCRLIKSHEVYGGGIASHDGDEHAFTEFERTALALAMVTGLPDFVRLWLEWVDTTREEVAGTRSLSSGTTRGMEYTRSVEDVEKSDMKLPDFIEKAAEYLHAGTQRYATEQADEELQRMREFLAENPEPIKGEEESEADFEERKHLYEFEKRIKDHIKKFSIKDFHKDLKIASRYSFRFSRY